MVDDDPPPSSHPLLSHFSHITRSAHTVYEVLHAPHFHRREGTFLASRVENSSFSIYCSTLARKPHWRQQQSCTEPAQERHLDAMAAKHNGLHNEDHGEATECDEEQQLYHDLDNAGDNTGASSNTDDNAATAFSEQQKKVSELPPQTVLMKKQLMTSETHSDIIRGSAQLYNGFPELQYSSQCLL